RWEGQSRVVAGRVETWAESVRRDGRFSAQATRAWRPFGGRTDSCGPRRARVVTMYLDSAIIVKLLVREADSDWFNRELQGQTFESSELALTEVRSALLAKERAGHVTSRERISATEKFLAMIEDDELRLF